MLEHDFEQLYLKFRAHFYKRLLTIIGTRKGSLSATELFCLETILLLDNPTISQFAAFLNISLPNANYKINSLVAKDFIGRVHSKDDKREYYLVPTEKYLTYRQINSEYNAEFIRQVEKALTESELQQISVLLKKLNKVMGDPSIAGEEKDD